MRILHVEDNDDNIDRLQNRLKRAGFTVMIARAASRSNRAR